VTSKTTGDGFAAIMTHHGSVTVETNIDDASIATVAVESTADTLIIARSMGLDAVELSDDEARVLWEMFMGNKPRIA
jgi:ribulose-5-phosphate 4-epimerase/fuculose-1-phosphate aldolase